MSELKDHKFIVVGGVYYSSIGLCKSIKESGFNPILIDISGNNKLGKFAKRYISEYYPTNSPEEAVLLLISRFGNEEYKPFIYTGLDRVYEALNNHYGELIDHFYFFNCAIPGNPNKYLDKKEMFRLVAGLDVTQPPRYECLRRGQLPQRVRYPIITKVTRPDAGAWKNDVNICRNEEELIKAWDNIVADEIFVQEYVEKKNELDVQGFSIDGGGEVICPYAIEYIRCSNKGYGWYMRVMPLTDREVFNDIQQMLKGMNFSGIFCVEYLVDKQNKRHFLEVNLRNDCFGYASTYGDFNLPYQWAKATLEGHINFNMEEFKRKEFTAMAASLDKYHIINYDVRALRWLWQYMTVDCLLDGDKKKPWPLYALVKALRSGFIKMWIKSVFKMYRKEDYPLAH